MLWLALGFAANLLVSALLSAAVDFSVALRDWDGPADTRFEPQMPLGGVSITVLKSLGTQRRGWYYNPDPLLNNPPGGGVFGYGRNPYEDHGFHFPTKEGPFISWTLGTKSSWGVLYATTLHSEAEADDFYGFEGASGFPALSFWHSLERMEDGAFTTPGAIRLPDGSQTTNPKLEIRAIPYRPIWPGLIFNTIFYALLAFITHRLVRTIREHRRFTKGRCPKCKYDLNANFAPGCPECGWRRTIPRPLGPAQ